MHPHKFVENARFKINDWDYGNVIQEDIRKKLANVHPKNIIGGELTAYLFEILVSYKTPNGNLKNSTKYIFLGENEVDEFDSPEFCAKVFAESKLSRYRFDNTLIEPKVDKATYLCMVVLPIG